jgi:hypothetical protein
MPPTMYRSSAPRAGAADENRNSAMKINEKNPERGRLLCTVRYGIVRYCTVPAAALLLFE